MQCNALKYNNFLLEPRKQTINQKMDQTRNDQSTTSPRYKRENRKCGQRGFRKELDKQHTTEEYSSQVGPVI